MSRSLVIGLGALLTACGLAPAPGFVPCQSDAQCGANKICFPEGCGEPGVGLVVEVEGDSRMGQLAQDFKILEGNFSPRNNFELVAPFSLTGEFQRKLSPSQNDLTFYSAPVSLWIKGESELIPGVVRSYKATFGKPERGTYKVAVGAGRYVVTAEAAEPSIPPLVGQVRVEGKDTPLNFAFASIEATLVVSGRLLKRIDPGPVPIDIPVTQAPMDVQAFDALTLRPLSQRRPVTSQGDFELFVAPEAATVASFVVIATPREEGALVPSKSFPISWPLPPQLRLVVGDFGDPLPQMKGEVRTTGGAPVAGAAVYLEGPVNGGGIFRSKVVTTDAEGVFRVDLLPSSTDSATDGSYQLTAIPPTKSVAGVVQKRVKAISKMGQVAYLQILDASQIICPDKISVIGRPRRPGSVDPAIGTTVVARAVEQLPELGNQPLSMGETQTVTNESGSFSLELDPGVYQVDFIPGENLPRTTRVVTVRAGKTAGPDGGTPSRTVDLGDFELRKGRQVTGKITAPNATGTGVAVSATVRYFRVSNVEGVATSLLLGEAVTDSLGNYSMVLPAK